MLARSHRSLEGIAMEVARGVHRLTKGVVNWYVIDDGGKLVVVDAGAPGDWDLLATTVGRLGRRLADVEAVLITHAHSDHIGFAERARTTTGAQVWIHEADADIARGGKAPRNDGGIPRYLLRAEFYRTLFSLLRRGAGRIVPVRELSTFSDGEVLDVPGRPRVLNLPGHTAGSAALHLESRGVLLTGDALCTRNPLTGRVGPQIMPSGLNRDTAAALNSLHLLEGVTAGVLLPGHGEPWRDGVEEALRAARNAGPS
jgi:glyoxylase-like metal-dependent hydrolase (beta-lactamase superfamily II)